MTTFEKWDYRYQQNWCTISQLKTLVRISVLTEEEYQEITGEIYAA